MTKRTTATALKVHTFLREPIRMNDRSDWKRLSRKSERANARIELANVDVEPVVLPADARFTPRASEPDYVPIVLGRVPRLHRVRMTGAVVYIHHLS